MTNELTQRYLRRATRGLWGRRRREVREELEAHLHDRVMAYRIGGLGEAEAVERALTELGSPQEVSVGMTRLYTLPTVMGSSLALVALCVFSIALWSKGVAQSLQGTFYWPSQECVDAAAKKEPLSEQRACIDGLTDFWVAQTTLKQVLEPQGVVFEEVFGPAAELLSITVPDTTAIFIPLGSSETMTETILLSEQGEVFTKAPGYLSLWDFIKKFSINLDTRLKISGWDDPTFQLNDVSFQIRDEVNPVKGLEFYGSYLWAVFFEESESVTDVLMEYSSINVVRPEDFISPSTSDFGETDYRQASLRVTGERDDVYGVISFFEPQNESAQPLKGLNMGEATFWVQLGRVNEQGNIDVKFPQSATTFVDSLSSDLKPGTSVLVRLAGGNRQGGGWYEIEAPQKITLEPTP